ncbi:MAG: NUDIX hydrolase [Candidatus Promineifilaceae bacterium]
MRLLARPGLDGPAAQRRMSPVPRAGRPAEKPGRPRLAAVLVLLYNRARQTHLVLTVRRDDLAYHAGQVSFPGGRREGKESLAQTALREAQEEIGLDPAALTLVGELTPLYIPPTDYEVHPFVAWHPGRPAFRPQPGEVAGILETPLGLLLNPATRRQERWNVRGVELEVPFYAIEGYQAWGATAMILSELLARLRPAENGDEDADGLPGAP